MDGDIVKKRMRIARELCVEIYCLHFTYGQLLFEFFFLFNLILIIYLYIYIYITYGPR